jgi:hypothetical protein
MRLDPWSHQCMAATFFRGAPARPARHANGPAWLPERVPTLTPPAGVPRSEGSSGEVRYTERGSYQWSRVLGWTPIPRTYQATEDADCLGGLMGNEKNSGSYPPNSKGSDK